MGIAKYPLVSDPRHVNESDSSSVVGLRILCHRESRPASVYSQKVRPWALSLTAHLRSISSPFPHHGLIERWTKRHSPRRPHQSPSCHRYARSTPASVPLDLELTPLISGIPTLFTPAAHTAPPTYTIPDAPELTRIPREYYRRDFHRWLRIRPNSNSCYLQARTRAHPGDCHTPPGLERQEGYNHESSYA